MADQFVAVVPTLGIGARAATPVPGGTPAPRLHDRTWRAKRRCRCPKPQRSAKPRLRPSNPPTRWGRSLPLATGLVVERPRVPDEPMQPVPERNMVMGLLAGLLLGVAAAMIREAADHTVRDAATLGRLTDLPTLAELPGRRGQTPRFGTDPYSMTPCAPYVLDCSKRRDPT